MTAVSPRTASPAPLRGQRALPRESRRGTARGWVWLLAASVLGVTGALEPLLTLIALVGGAVLVLAIAAPRITAGLTALVVLFVRPLEHLVPIPQVGYMDEGLILLCLITMPLRRLIARQPLRDFPGQWWFAGFLVCGLLSALVVQVPTGTFFLGAFIVSKGLLFGWAVAQIDWSERHLAIAARVGVVLIALCVLAGVINFVARGPWEALLASDANASEARSFLPSLIGPFTHPIDFGQFMALAFLAVAAWRAAVGRSALTLVLLLATAMSALASARRTSIGGLVVGWLWMQAKVRSTSVLVALLAGLPIVIIVLAGPLAAVGMATYESYLGSGDPAARTVLTRDSFIVAASYFPLGAGFGRFGSAVAATTYSPEYIALGYPDDLGVWAAPRRPGASSRTPNGRRSSARRGSSARWPSRSAWWRLTVPACGCGEPAARRSSGGPG